MSVNLSDWVLCEFCEHSYVDIIYIETEHEEYAICEGCHAEEFDL